MSAPHFAHFVIARPWLYKLMMPMARWYVNSCGYYKLGLRTDDLIPEENEVVLKAISRLSPQESYDRIYRLRRATQCSIQHKLLPKDQWTKAEDDRPYLTHVIEQVEAELKEENELDSMTPTKKQ